MTTRYIGPETVALLDKLVAEAISYRFADITLRVENGKLRRIIGPARSQTVPDRPPGRGEKIPGRYSKDE